MIAIRAWWRRCDRTVLLIGRCFLPCVSAVKSSLIFFASTYEYVRSSSQCVVRKCPAVMQHEAYTMCEYGIQPSLRRSPLRAAPLPCQQLQASAADLRRFFSTLGRGGEAAHASHLAATATPHAVGCAAAHYRGASVAARTPHGRAPAGGCLVRSHRASSHVLPPAWLPHLQSVDPKYTALRASLPSGPNSSLETPEVNPRAMERKEWIGRSG